jgi:glycosyltransferase involved in cell wall biosynthesis
MTDRPVAAVVVRNTASHDARVLRCARTLRALGYEAVVVAVTSDEETAPRAVAQGVPIVRLTPRAPLAGLARGLRRRGRRGAGRAARGATDGGARELGGGGARPGPLARAYRLLRTLSWYRRGIAAMRRLQPQVVHCNDYNTMWIGVAAKLLAGSALVYDSHELWPDRNGRSEPRWWLLACEALFLRIADRNLATSPGHAAAIARRHRVAPPRVVRNIAERPAGNGGRPAFDGERASRGQTIAYVGAVTGSRGLEQAIAALPAAPGVTLRILGPGSEPYRELLAGLAERRGVSDRVRLAAPMPPQRVVEEIAPAAAGAALIQPSCLSYELSLPNKLFEYLAAGLPILASEVPVIREFVERNGVGLVVAPDDPAAIAAAMTAIVEPKRNAELRVAVREASARLSWEREAEGLAKTYREAVAAAGGAR